MNASAAFLNASARQLLAIPLLASAVVSAHAQTTNPIQQEPVTTLEQKTERITHEDAGSRIDELRVGGQTRSIQVQTKTRVPGYDVKPLDASQPDDGKGSTGKSSWRLLNF